MESRWLRVKKHFFSRFLTPSDLNSQESEAFSGDEILPDETWLHIFKFLGGQKNLASVGSVNKRFKAIASDPSLIFCEDINAIAVSPDASLIAVAVNKREIVVQTINGGQVCQLRQTNKGIGHIHGMHFMQDNQFLIVARHDLFPHIMSINFEIWDLASHTLKYTVDYNHFIAQKHFRSADKNLHCDQILYNTDALPRGKLFIALVDNGLPGYQKTINFFILDVSTGIITEQKWGTITAAHIDIVNALCVAKDGKSVVFLCGVSLYQCEFNIPYAKATLLANRPPNNEVKHTSLECLDQGFLLGDEMKNGALMLTYYDSQLKEIRKVAILDYKKPFCYLEKKFSLSADGRLIAFFHNEDEKELFDFSGKIKVFDTVTEKYIYEESVTLNSLNLKRPVLFVGNDTILLATANSFHLRALPALALQDEKGNENERPSLRFSR